MLSRQTIHYQSRPCSPPLQNNTSLIVIPRAHLADSTDYRCATPSRFICYCPRNPRFHFFRHYTHWHRLASHRLLHFTGASWIRCPKWLLAFGHSTALNFFLCFLFPYGVVTFSKGFSGGPTITNSFAAHLHTSCALVLTAAAIFRPARASSRVLTIHNTPRFVIYRRSKLLHQPKKSPLYHPFGRSSPLDALVK